MRIPSEGRSCHAMYGGSMPLKTLHMGIGISCSDFTSTPSSLKVGQHARLNVCLCCMQVGRLRVMGIAAMTALPCAPCNRESMAGSFLPVGNSSRLDCSLDYRGWKSPMNVAFNHIPSLLFLPLSDVMDSALDSA